MLKKNTIVVLGDSITLAAHQPENRRWPNRLEAGLRKKFPGRRIVVINAGVGGNTSREGLRRLERDVIRRRPDFVTVEFGGNDATPDMQRHVSLREFKANLEALRKKIEATGARMVMLTFTPIIDRRHFLYGHKFYRKLGGQDAYIEQYRRLTREFALRHGLVLADTDRALRRAIKARGVGECYLQDGAHLTALGNRLVARTVVQALAPLLRQSARL